MIIIIKILMNTAWIIPPHTPWTYRHIHRGLVRQKPGEGTHSMKGSTYEQPPPTPHPPPPTPTPTPHPHPPHPQEHMGCNYCSFPRYLHLTHRSWYVLVYTATRYLESSLQAPMLSHWNVKIVRMTVLCLWGLWPHPPGLSRKTNLSYCPPFNIPY